MRSIAVVALAAAAAMAQPDGPAPPLNADPTDTNNKVLVGKAFPYDKLPYRVDTLETERGTQTGYNICNSTTEGQSSLCQTLIVNSLKDFCLWGPPEPNSPIGNAEGEVVAWCTQPGHGSRLIPAGAITGAQFIRTQSYIEFTGHIKQSLINVPDDDAGGELDSGGQDQRGNPIGGVAYSDNLPSTPGAITQSRVWHVFQGSGVFCMKFCDDKAPNARGLCRHTLDTLGCNTNVPAAYKDGVFESCEGDDQQPVQQGVTDIPASRNCQTFQSAELWDKLPGGSTSTTATTTGGGTKPTNSAGHSSTTTGADGRPTAVPDNGAASMRIGSYAFAAALAGLVAGAVFA
ncbi:hypothetical protein AURDEDRAFT_115776 [Auricularia subglabra TFB-10046 SS5]|nr:hypothetical protein AURDEDRAFT_115776 [Auricularia subglabra TFB-10046 SS5]